MRQRRFQLDIILPIRYYKLKSVPHHRILDLSELGTLSYYKLNAAEIMISVFERVKNIASKRENTVDNHFLIFP